jgi:hypothetical protein
MGALTDFDLRHLITDYGCRVLVETGIGKGQATDEAAELDFLQIFAIEPQHKRALDVALRHAANHKITVIHAKIERGLAEALAEISSDHPVLFWLAAHQPGGDGRPKLEDQLRQIGAARDIRHDIILVDELRLYEDGAYDEGPCPDGTRPLPEFRQLAFIETVLGQTHDIQRSRRRGGYLCAFPRVED